MDALREALDRIHSSPTHSASSTLRELIKSLDVGEQFDLNKLYQLNYADFALAMNVLKQWRLDSYRYEPGFLNKATDDPALRLDVTTLRYGRWAEVREPETQ